ncbi:Cysteine dioxygenase [Madurella mycetomatis]|uniref:Cysteine dioxygenase n=1 Tax=Madurella mycetomatis TaxID=100816 RepID=A0A175VNX6_9PEZI|nr:Cysteine dioxygenase [Madurella mycetomatis]
MTTTNATDGVTAYEWFSAFASDRFDITDFEDTCIIEKPTPYQTEGATFPLRVEGQGTIVVKQVVNDYLSMTVKSDGNGTNYRLRLTVREDRFDLRVEDDEHEYNFPLGFDAMKLKAAYVYPPRVEATYWLSLDKNNGRIRYGKHFPARLMTVVEARLDMTQDKYKWLKNAKHVDIGYDEKRADCVRVLKLPVVLDLSPFIAPRDRVTLRDLENAKFTFPADLPDACRPLYERVAGADVTLHDNDFPEFGAAIDASCREGLCKNLLQQKAARSGGQEKKTYLRITLGCDQGNSPGVPYVLEIWPIGHSSPIHDHSNACGIIKVLYGKIQVNYFSSVSNGSRVGAPTEFQQGQITWLSPQYYQIHQLSNPYESVCCTIQCYRYEDNDDTHSGVFTYVDGENGTRQFSPSSDMEFNVFRTKIKEEWAQRTAAGGVAS